MNHFREKQPYKRKSVQMVSKLDETWRVVFISQTMYVVKFKGCYDKKQWYVVRSCTIHFEASVFLPETSALKVEHIIFKCFEP